jgi:hypothetical protein
MSPAFMIYFAPGQPLPAYLQEAQELHPLQPQHFPFF